MPMPPMFDRPKKTSTPMLIIAVLIGAGFLLIFAQDAWDALTTGAFTTRSRKGGPARHFSREADPVSFYGLIVIWLWLGAGLFGAALWDLHKRIQGKT